LPTKRTSLLSTSRTSRKKLKRTRSKSKSAKVNSRRNNSNTPRPKLMPTPLLPRNQPSSKSSPSS
jgi:hypothetical protein